MIDAGAPYNRPLQGTLTTFAPLRGKALARPRKDRQCPLKKLLHNATKIAPTFE
jgi:hypothetical protein